MAASEIPAYCVSLLLPQSTHTRMASLSQLLKIALATTPRQNGITLATIHKLDDMGAFAGHPALRFIMTTATRNGTFSRFAACGEWNADAGAEIERLVAHTGFRPNLVDLVFSAYAEAMQWIPDNATRHGDCIASEPEIPWQQRSQYAPPAVGINREKEPYRGITIENAATKIVDTGKIMLTATLRRTAPLGSGILGYALADADGTLMSSGVITAMTVTSPSVVPVTATITSPRPPASITLCVS